MREKTYLRNDFPNSTELYNINSRIKDWDYSEINGVGFYQKYTGHYGHIEIKISKSEDLHSHQLINNLNENQLPTIYLNEVINCLNFLISYIPGIKGERINLKFEIIDGSFHITESKRTDFQVATFYSIIDCFDKSIRQISARDLEMINNCKELSKK